MSVSDGPGRVSSWPEILAFARHAESIGLDSVWVCDHFLSSASGGPVEGIHGSVDDSVGARRVDEPFEVRCKT
jgi:alkanesulfonate monooxygenase SsuD/methylene tetrahydromethanopterin reductase-like flavin-dependent oxidoreductase (luciferase family)